ncbi:unnamed protein product [Adineta steineri]|uniref:Uncharacterized protein n=1 Tax=Adineta steineri TaxID=433720 RepID=A0A813MZK0_9BILA|nr:unnamed protein product [Adineta steineri]CAF3665049.1 unnamed protein product [Adineta steineri]
MQYKSVIFILFLFTLLTTSQANESFNIPSDNHLMNHIEVVKHEPRSLGCNGVNDQNVHKCRMHCRSRKFKNGRCSKLSNYMHCVCYTSLNPKA